MSSARTIRLKAWRPFCAFLMLLAAIYAVLPSGPPLQPRSGSAFSATTIEVATGCATRPEIERRALPTAPAPPPAACRAPRLALTAPGGQRPANRAYRARAPPLPEPALSPLNPRAPPTAA